MKTKKLLYQEMIRMQNANHSIKKAEKQAKKDIKKALMPYEPMQIETREELLQKTKDTLDELIRLQGDEDLIDQEIEFQGKNALLKKRLVHLYCSGRYTQRQLSQIFCVSPNTIGKWLRQEDVKEAINIIQSEEDILATTMMKALRIKAIERQAELIDGDNPMVSAIMIRDLLDRTGHKPVEKKQVDVTMTYEERLQKLVEGVEYEVTDVEESDLSRPNKISTEGENDDGKNLGESNG